MLYCSWPKNDLLLLDFFRYTYEYIVVPTVNIIHGWSEWHIQKNNVEKWKIPHTYEISLLSLVLNNNNKLYDYIYFPKQGKMFIAKKLHTNRSTSFWVYWCANINFYENEQIDNGRVTCSKRIRTRQFSFQTFHPLGEWGGVVVVIALYDTS